ncbi:hypothetical protein [Streptomyces sp. NPDC002088]|uniref:hypothetical protein n=1 Tax=Streptomyces sp. NPDC002088 TaxID=3154665 RepID=UPI0033194235
MSALLFVHGTGVRRAAYDETIAELRKGLADVDADLQVHECYWGDVFGVPEGAGAATLPSALSPALPSALSPAVPAAGPWTDPSAALAESSESSGLSERDRDALTWELLYEDPLAPLRRTTGEADGIYDEPPDPRLEHRARDIAATPPDELAALLEEAGAHEEFRLAVTAVLDSPAGRDALTQGLPPGELPTALATAAVAHVLAAIARQGRPLRWTPERRDEAIGILAAALGGGDTRGVLSGTWKVVAPLGGMRYLMWKRPTLMDKAHPRAADILKYLARGDRLRTFIEERVAEVAAAHGPLVLLAHSLGGIAAVDLLAAQDLPAVRHLVTIGSQAAHLHELGALPCLDPGAPLPDHFPRWTNVYDRRDLLAFLAEPAFPGRVQDRELTSGQPFKASHSAYFRNPDVLRLLAQVVRDGSA